MSLVFWCFPFYLVCHFLLNAGILDLPLFSQLFKCIQLFLSQDDIMKMIMMIIMTILMTMADVASDDDDDDVMKMISHACLWGSVLSVQNGCLLYVAERKHMHATLESESS